MNSPELDELVLASLSPEYDRVGMARTLWLHSAKVGAVCKRVCKDTGLPWKHPSSNPWSNLSGRHGAFSNFLFGAVRIDMRQATRHLVHALLCPQAVRCLHKLAMALAKQGGREQDHEHESKRSALTRAARWHQQGKAGHEKCIQCVRLCVTMHKRDNNTYNTDG